MNSREQWPTVTLKVAVCVCSQGSPLHPPTPKQTLPYLLFSALAHTHTLRLIHTHMFRLIHTLLVCTHTEPLPAFLPLSLCCSSRCHHISPHRRGRLSLHLLPGRSICLQLSGCLLHQDCSSLPLSFPTNAQGRFTRQDHTPLRYQRVEQS